MKIGLILNPYGEKQTAGLERSIFSLSKNIVEKGMQDEFTVFLKGRGGEKPIFLTNKDRFVRFLDVKFWLDLGFLGREKLDAYVFFTPVIPLFVRLKNVCVVVHDLGYLNLPANNLRQKAERFFIKFIHHRSLKRADKVIAVSEYTKKEIGIFFPDVLNKVEVVLNGFDKIKEDSAIKVDLPQAPFFLFLGVLKERKNPFRVIEAFEAFKKDSGSPALLVIAGRGNSKAEEMIKNSAYSDDIVYLGYVTDGERAFLYKNALAFVFPSLLEGFGLPILEAMSVGTPVITSNIGAMKEVAGEAALTVDPYSVPEITEAIKRIWVGDEFKKELAKKGLERSSLFSWEKAGSNYLEIIHGFTTK